MWAAVSGSYEFDPENKNSRSVECACECGTVRRVMVDNLFNGLSRGAGVVARVPANLSHELGWIQANGLKIQVLWQGI